MTEERFKALEPFSGHLYTATYCSFIRITDNQVKMQLENLYEAEFGSNGNILAGCNRCVLNALTKLGKVYFAYKKELEEKEKEEPKPEIVGGELEPDSQVTENKAVKKPKAKTAANKTKKKK